MISDDLPSLERVSVTASYGSGSLTGVMAVAASDGSGSSTGVMRVPITLTHSSSKIQIEHY